MIGGLCLAVIAACGDANNGATMAVAFAGAGAGTGSMPFAGGSGGAQAGTMSSAGGTGGMLGTVTGGAGAGGSGGAGMLAPASDAGTEDAGHTLLDAGPDAQAGSDAGDAGEPAVAAVDAGGGTAGRGAEPPMSPVHRVPLRVHLGNSGLSGQELAAVLEEMNWIWWSQAAVCFEVETVDNDQTLSGGFDLWFHETSIPCSPGANGVYCGDHDIHSLDAPRLGRTDAPDWSVELPPARTAAHELGHGLTLDHFNGQPDSNDSLMSSGRMGFKLHEAEIQAARRRAAAKALPDDGSEFCTPVSPTDE